MARQYKLWTPFTKNLGPGRGIVNIVARDCKIKDHTIIEFACRNGYFFQNKGKFLRKAKECEWMEEHTRLIPPQDFKIMQLKKLAWQMRKTYKVNDLYILYKMIEDL